MRLSMHFVTAILLSFLIIGCDRPETLQVIEEPLFCDLTEPRRFSQAELEWRAENAPWNLRRDHKTNADYDRECVEPTA